MTVRKRTGSKRTTAWPRSSSSRTGNGERACQVAQELRQYDPLRRAARTPEEIRHAPREHVQSFDLLIYNVELPARSLPDSLSEQPCLHPDPGERIADLVGKRSRGLPQARKRFPLLRLLAIAQVACKQEDERDRDACNGKWP